MGQGSAAVTVIGVLVAVLGGRKTVAVLDGRGGRAADNVFLVSRGGDLVILWHGKGRKATGWVVCGSGVSVGVRGASIFAGGMRLRRQHLLFTLEIHDSKVRGIDHDLSASLKDQVLSFGNIGGVDGVGGRGGESFDLVMELSVLLCDTPKDTGKFIWDS